MAGRITGPYKGFFINASASLNGAPGGANAQHYVGTLSLTEHGVDEPRKLERLVELGDAQDFADDQAALVMPVALHAPCFFRRSSYACTASSPARQRRVS